MERTFEQTSLGFCCFSSRLWGLVFGCCLGGGTDNSPSGLKKLDGQPFEGQMRKIGTSGYKVVQDGRGKVTLEKIPFYGRDASAKIRGKNSKKLKVVRPSPDSLWGKGKAT